MSVFRRRLAPPVEARSALPFGFQQYVELFAAGGLGVSSIDEAMRDAATWVCVKVKAQGVASLPVDVVLYEGRKRISVPAPLIITKPSSIVQRRVWTFQAASSMFTDGNVFGLVMDVDAMVRPTRIELVNPTKVTERKVVENVVQARIDGKVHRAFPHGDLWHVPGEMVEAGSPFGLSPVWYGSKSTATSLAAEAFGGQFFTDGGHPAGILGVDGDPGEEGVKKTKAAFLQATKGNREPVVLPSSSKYTQLTVNPSDSQFLDLMNFEVVQACRRHGVPPSMAYAAIAGENITYANVTQADLQFLKHTLSYPIDLFEDAQSALLPQPRVVKYNRDAILRADPLARAQVQEIRLRNRTTTVNEQRTLEDEEPFGPEFDVPGIPPMAGATPPVAPPDDPDEGGAE